MSRLTRQASKCWRSSLLLLAVPCLLGATRSPVDWEGNAVLSRVAQRGLAGVEKVDERFIRHVVFDLDWTLISEMEEWQTADPSNVIEASGKRYRVAEHAAQVIRKLADDPRVKVSFFSGGEPSRNEAVLRAISLGDGRTAWDIAHRVLSKPDLTQRVNDPEKKQPFARRWGKDIFKIVDDPEHVILVDDILNFVLRKQRKNQIWLPNTRVDFDTYEEAEKARLTVADPSWIPANEEEFFMNRHKLAGAYAIIAEALDEEGVHALPADPRDAAPRRFFSGLTHQKQSAERRPYIEKGLRLLNHEPGRCTIERTRVLLD